MISCKQCGCKRFEVIEEERHLQILRCCNCGGLIESRFYPKNQLSNDLPVRVLFRWVQTEPTARDAVGLKKISPVADRMGLSELLSKLRSERIWDAGIHSCYNAEELTRKSAELGFDEVEFRDVEDPEAPDKITNSAK